MTMQDPMADLLTQIRNAQQAKITEIEMPSSTAKVAVVKVLKEEELFLSLDSQDLHQAIDDLLGSGTWERPRHWGGFLLNFPDCSPEAWSIPADGWHVDFHYTNEPGTQFGLRVFTFLGEAGPRGGGTLVVRGSHRLVEKFVRAMTAVMTPTLFPRSTPR